MKSLTSWIRTDREKFFMGGFSIACLIAAMTTTYWYSLDRTSVAPNITLTGKSLSRAAEYKKIKETQTLAPNLGAGGTQYYRLEEKHSLPRIPDLKPDYDNN